MIAALVALPIVLPSALHAESAGQSFSALQVLEPGEWELRTRGANAEAIRLCAADIRQLLQPRHPGQSCTRFVVEDAARRTVITYDCAGSGQGRTSVRVETARLVQIDSQGISNGLPFALLAEGRRVGTCKAQVAGR
jgi:hypothetical protein